MTDTGQRARLFGVLKQMEADTVRMYEAAIGQAGDDEARANMRELRDAHARHVRAMDELLGPCDAAEAAPPADVSRALDQQVEAVRQASGAAEALDRLRETEWTTAQEYAVAESSRLSPAEASEIHRLHQEQRGFAESLQ